jgi:hypothetical protein
MRESWPHAPPHYFTPHATYLITAATLHRKRLFDSDEKLDLSRDTTFELAKNYALIPFCRGSRAGCNDLDFAGDTPAAAGVTLDRSRRFLPGMASRPRSPQGQPEPDCRERSSISPHNFRHRAKCDQRIQVAKVAILARQTLPALDHRSTTRV